MSSIKEQEEEMSSESSESSMSSVSSLPSVEALPSDDEIQHPTLNMNSP